METLEAMAITPNWKRHKRRLIDCNPTFAMHRSMYFNPIVRESQKL